jgi:hypothetical protein
MAHCVASFSLISKMYKQWLFPFRANRLFKNYKAEADGISTDQIIAKLMKA